MKSVCIQRRSFPSSLSSQPGCVRSLLSWLYSLIRFPSQWDPWRSRSVKSFLILSVRRLLSNDYRAGRFKESEWINVDSVNITRETSLWQKKRQVMENLEERHEIFIVYHPLSLNQSWQCSMHFILHECLVCTALFLSSLNLFILFPVSSHVWWKHRVCHGCLIPWVWCWIEWNLCCLWVCNSNCLAFDHNKNLESSSIVFESHLKFAQSCYQMKFCQENKSLHEKLEGKPVRKLNSYLFCPNPFIKQSYPGADTLTFDE